MTEKRKKGRYNPAQLARLLDPFELQRRAARQRHADRRWSAYGLNQLALFVHTARNLRDEEITRRAAALTYHTLLSIVPVLAVAFALFKAFGGLTAIEAPLKATVVENLSAGRSEEIGQWLDKFISNINAGAIAGVGVIFLFYTALGLLSNVEAAFNRIWGIKRSRPLYMRFAIYWCILTLAPPLVGLSLSVSARLQSSVFAETVRHWLPWGLGHLVLSGASLLSICLVFVFLYQLVPNTKVRFRSALIGGIVAGLLWSGSKTLFLWATAGSVKYSAVYGALGALPLIMLWIYVSWIIVLFGVTFTFANQSVSTARLEAAHARIDQSFRELLAVRIMAAAASTFRRGETPETIDELAEGTGAPMAAVREVIETLATNHLLQEIGSGDARYAPARALDTIGVTDILRALRRSEDAVQPDGDLALHHIAELLKTADAASDKTLASWTLNSLASEIDRKQALTPEGTETAADGSKAKAKPAPDLSAT